MHKMTKKWTKVLMIMNALFTNHKLKLRLPQKKMQTIIKELKTMH